jgi:osmotically-inducible protein OsmY
MKGKKRMAKRNHLRTALILAVGLLLWSATARTNVGLAQAIAQTPAQSAAQTPCTATTDAQLVAAIQEKIKADHRFDDQWRHINVSLRNRIVTLRGWAMGSQQVRDLIRLARTTRCVRRVVNKLRPFRSNLGCMPGQKRCGDLCIDMSETCNLIQ